MRQVKIHPDDAEDRRIEFRLGAADGYQGDTVALIGKGRNVYVWIGRDNAGDNIYFSGQKSLRALAKAILKEVGEND